jgi:hypothetical protein
MTPPVYYPNIIAMHRLIMAFVLMTMMILAKKLKTLQKPIRILNAPRQQQIIKLLIKQKTKAVAMKI